LSKVGENTNETVVLMYVKRKGNVCPKLGEKTREAILPMPYESKRFGKRYFIYRR
jgi:hypothetical protein